MDIVTIKEALKELPPVKEKTLIIGKGEIGTSLGNVLSEFYDVQYKDNNIEAKGKFRVMNICFGYTKNFVNIVKEYQKRYKPELTIIHSTVPTGTTRKVGGRTVYSPIHGRHPDLTTHIKKFVKILSGLDAYSEYDASVYLQDAGLKITMFSTPESLEFSKRAMTRRYGWYLAEMKLMVEECSKLGVPFFEVYTMMNALYNNGYNDEKFLNLPIYEPMRGEVGGHCVIPNLDLDGDSKISKILKELNEHFKKEV